MIRKHIPLVLAALFLSGPVLAENKTTDKGKKPDQTGEASIRTNSGNDFFRPEDAEAWEKAFRKNTDQKRRSNASQSVKLVGTPTFGLAPQSLESILKFQNRNNTTEGTENSSSKQKKPSHPSWVGDQTNRSSHNLPTSSIKRYRYIPVSNRNRNNNIRMRSAR